MATRMQQRRDTAPTGPARTRCLPLASGASRTTPARRRSATARPLGRPGVHRRADLRDKAGVDPAWDTLQEIKAFIQSDESTATALATTVAGKAPKLTPTAVKTANYAAAAGDLVPVDTTSGAVTVTLPTAPADGTVLHVKHVIQGGTNTVTVVCGGSDVINKASGVTSMTLTLLAHAALLQYKASSGIWYVVADDLALSQLDARFQSLPAAGAPVLFVDSANGNNSNDGLTQKSAKATIAAAITALPSTGGTIRGFGTFIETVTLPAFPKIVNLAPLGSRRNFVVQAPAINTPAIQCALAAVELATIDCTVQPHTSGTTGGLVLMDGMRNMTLLIDYIDNGSGGCDRIFDARVGDDVLPEHDRVDVHRAVPCGAGVFCGNGGTAGTNPNICRIDDPFIYANAGMTTVSTWATRLTGPSTVDSWKRRPEPSP